MKKFRLVTSIIALIFVLAIVGFGIYVALMPAKDIYNNITFIPYEAPSFEIDCQAEWVSGEEGSHTVSSDMGQPDSLSWKAPDIDFNRVMSRQATLSFTFRNTNLTNESLKVTISGVVTDLKTEYANNPRFTTVIRVGDLKTINVGSEIQDPEAGVGNDVGFTIAKGEEIKVEITYSLDRTDMPIDVRQELVFNLSSVNE